MMNRVFINESTPLFEGNDAITAHFSMRCRDIADDATETGFVARKTFEALGLMVMPDTTFNSLILEGSAKEMIERAPTLQQNIGFIARYGSEKATGLGDVQEVSRDWWGCLLGRYVWALETSEIPEKPEGILTPFETITCKMLRDFVGYCGDQREATVILRGTLPWWPVSKTELEFTKIIPPRATIATTQKMLDGFRRSQD